ncbi:hypothetical protein FRB95_004354 [Tulasnella sp. JGI-2019a]|nr:hypothetical protein FRB95_004354 [Tulasnella sp. JGI-2019a]
MKREAVTSEDEHNADKEDSNSEYPAACAAKRRCLTRHKTSKIKSEDPIVIPSSDEDEPPRKTSLGPIEAPIKDSVEAFLSCIDPPNGQLR